MTESIQKVSSEIGAKIPLSLPLKRERLKNPSQSPFQKGEVIKIKIKVLSLGFRN